MTVLLQLAALAYAFVLPGVLVAAVADRDWSWGMRLAGGFTLGLLIVPLGSFCAAWALATNVQVPLVVGVATVINVGCGVGLWVRRR